MSSYIKTDFNSPEILKLIFKAEKQKTNSYEKKNKSKPIKNIKFKHY